MKTIGVEKTNLDSCIIDAQKERIVVTRQGKPVAVVIGIDEEQLERGSSDAFWKMIKERRDQDTVSREALECLINSE